MAVKYDAQGNPIPSDQYTGPDQLDPTTPNTDGTGNLIKAPTTGSAQLPTQPAAGAGGAVDPYARQKFQDAWAASPTHDTAALQKLIGSDPAYAGITANGDRVSLPGYTEAGTGIYRGPEQIDAIGDVGGANSWAWSGIGGANGDGTDPGNPSAAMSAGAAGGAAGAAGSASGVASPYDSLIHDQILKMLQQGNAPVTADDPSITGQFDPIARTIDRGAASTREAAAERLAQQGLNAGGSGGALDGDVNSINEQAGEAKGSLMGQLVTSELQARRQQVTDALGAAQGEEKNALQLKLAQIDAQLREQGLQIQSTQVNNQNSQFYDNLGANIGSDEYLYNELFGQGLGAGA